MREFEFLKYLKQHFNLDLIGDDCAVLGFSPDHDLLATADLLIEGTDFDLRWSRPSDIGHKALAVSLSDIAAMGGEPLWALVSIGVPEGLFEKAFLTEFYAGLRDLAEQFDVRIAGGDVSAGTEVLTIDSIVLGRCPAGLAIRRDGASPGDLVCVSGELGGAAAGLRLLSSARSMIEIDEIRDHPACIKQLKPLPQVALGKYLLEKTLATSMVDLSDGLSSDLKRICEASGVGAAVAAEKLPIDKSIPTPAVSSLPDASDNLDLALNGGEDFELLFTTTPDNADRCAELGCTVIGEILADRSSFKLISNGVERELVPAGYEHFSGQD